LEERIIPTLKELGIGLVPFSPVGRGFLTGQIKRFEDIPEGDYRRTDPRYKGENFQKNLALVKQVEHIAKKHHATASQIAIAWTLQQGPDFVPIPGTKRILFLEENSASWKLHLDESDLAELNSLAHERHGERYDANALARVER
jgi:aryl-alcohol dehydrogenase-like predicted oxidoreductase